MEPEEFRDGCVRAFLAVAGFLGFVGLTIYRAWRELVLSIPKSYRWCHAQIGSILTQGWRPMWGWMGITVGLFTFLYAPLAHLAVDAGNVNIFLAFCTAQYFGRGAEKLISIGALQIPGMGWAPQPPEGGPRPMAPA